MCLQPVAEHYSLDGVLTLVDAKHVGQHLDEEKEEGVVNEAIAQVAYADRIILNKTDLVRMRTHSHRTSFWRGHYFQIFSRMCTRIKLRAPYHVKEGRSHLCSREFTYLRSMMQVSEAEVASVERRLSSINNLAQVVRAQRADVKAEYVLGIGGFDLDRVADEARRSHTPVSMSVPCVDHCHTCMESPCSPIYWHV